MMKKYKIILAIFTGFIIINSCTTNDLELTNPNQISPETYFEKEVQVQAAVNAAYSNLQTFSLYGRLLFYMMDNMSHENASNPQQEGDKITFANFDFDSSNVQIEEFWDSCYRGINKANFVIENSDIINALPEVEINTITKNKFLAEARFLRAHYYWLLVNRFGDIPLRTDNNSDPEGKPKSSKQDVINLIIEDLTFASSNLLAKGVEVNGRATKGAAQAFLGKVYLFEKQYQLALNSFNQMSGYALEANYFDNFREETEHGIESVFEVEYNIALGTGNKWDSPTAGAGANHATFRGQDYGVLNWFNVYPSDDLVAEFEPNDTRFSDSFYVPGDVYNNGSSVFAVSDFQGSIRNIAWKKYQNYYKQVDEAQESGINVKVIRYSDVLLMKAECLNEVSTQASAITEINTVRNRAGLPSLPLSLSKTEVFDAIVHERKVELSGEQVRFDDMLRWGIASSELMGTGFQSGINELWPIPDKEISTNINMNLVDQNSGY